MTTISADHIPANATIITGKMGKVAIYGTDFGYAKYPVRYSAALLTSDNRIAAQVYNSISELGALTALYQSISYKSIEVATKMAAQAAHDLKGGL
jgi:hypothetical protein